MHPTHPKNACVHVDTAAGDARTQTLSLVSEGFVQQEQRRANLLKACAYECFMTRFSFDCEAAFLIKEQFKLGRGICSTKICSGFP